MRIEGCHSYRRGRCPEVCIGTDGFLIQAIPYIKNSFFLPTGRGCGDTSREYRGKQQEREDGFSRFPSEAEMVQKSAHTFLPFLSIEIQRMPEQTDKMTLVLFNLRGKAGRNKGHLPHFLLFFGSS